MIDTIKKKRKRGDAPVDNFVVFKERLTNASTDLHERRDLLRTRLNVLQIILTSNITSLKKWEDNYRDVASIHDAYSGNEEGERVLIDLKTTAERMVNLFSKRVDLLGVQVTSTQSKIQAIKTAIDEVDTSTSKLEFSKILNDDREKLALAEARLGGDLPLGLTSDGNGLPPELQTAREAVAMAEALLELRGN